MTIIYMPCEVASVNETNQQTNREIFDSIDTNKDGCIRMNELKRFLSTNESVIYPKGMCSMILKIADRNRDGKISLDEFIKLCEPVAEIITENYVQRCTEMISLPMKAYFRPNSEYSYENQMLRYKTNPLLIICICVVQILFFINDQIHIKMTKSLNATSEQFSSLSTIMLFDNDRKSEVWRFVTYLFVQKDIAHIVSNICMQLFTGLPLEAEHGCLRVLIVFIASVVAGSMSIAALCSNCVAVVGGSAGAYGLLGAHFSTVILNWREMEYRAIRLFILVTFIIVDFFLLFNNPSNTVANSTITHCSGFLVGFFIAVVLLRNLKVRDWVTYFRSICLRIYIFIVLIQLSFIIFEPNFDIHHL